MTCRQHLTPNLIDLIYQGKGMQPRSHRAVLSATVGESINLAHLPAKWAEWQLYQTPDAKILLV